MSSETAQNLIILAAIFGSVMVWIGLWFHRRRTGSFVRWEPRRPAPWGPLGLMLAFLYSSLLVTEALTRGSDRHAETPVRGADDFVWYTLWVSIIALVLIGFSQVWLWGTRTATCRDLGWPTDWRMWWQDIRLGLVGSVAMIGPVYLLLVVLVHYFNWTTSHPLIEEIQQAPRLDSMATIAFSVIVQAPIFEELLYRQLAQGWLERVGDEMSLSDRDRTPSPSPTMEPASIESAASSAAVADSSDPSAGEPPCCWWPVLVSSTLFALAHWGHGSAPIPLFFLALILGYLYRRTHRILPCIVLHMAFNAFAVVLLGFQIWGQ